MTSLPNIEGDVASSRVSHGVQVLMAYAGIRHAKDLALRISMTQQTLSRRLSGQQGWMFHEVVAVAAYFGVTLDEMLNGLPTLEEWTDRQLQLRARRDSNPQPSDLVLAPLRLVKGGLTAERPSARIRTRHLKAVS